MAYAVPPMVQPAIKPPKQDSTNAAKKPSGRMGPLGEKVARVHIPGAVHHQRNKLIAQATVPAIIEATCRQGRSFGKRGLDSYCSISVKSLCSVPGVARKIYDHRFA